MNNKWADKTRALILSGELPEGNIRAIRNILARAINEGNGTAEQAEALIELVEEQRPRVTDEQAKKGAAWLYKMTFTSRGLQRCTDFAQAFNTKELEIIRFLQSRPIFALIGFVDTREWSSRYCRLYPIYRAYGEDGESFDYCGASWQSGVASFIVRHA